MDRLPTAVRVLGPVLAFVGVAVWLTVTTWHQLSSSRLDVGPLTDFRDAIYYPVVALRDGVNPYAVETYYRHYPVGQEFPLYTPVHLLLHAPLLAFSFPAARAVNFGWNLALVVVFAGVVLRVAGQRLRVDTTFGLATLILVSDPGKFDLRSGQPTLMIAIAFLLAWGTASGRVREAAGPGPPFAALVGVLGLAIVWSKPTFAIPLVLFLVATSRLRIAARGTALALALSAVLLPFLVDAAGGVGHLVDSWQESARITSRSSQSRLGSGLRIDVGNAFVRITHLHPSEGAATIGGLALLAVGGWIVWRLHRHDPRHDREELVVTLVVLLTLTALYHVPYDYLLLALPLVLLVRRRATVPTAWPRRVRVVVPLLLLLPAVDPLGWSVGNAVLGKSGFQWMFGPTMFSVYVLTALGLCVWTAFRQLAAPVAEPAPLAMPGPPGGGVDSITR
ncbi:MAG: glycosyltransferase family 87 protein [Acidimicrobiia bacterium]